MGDLTLPIDVSVRDPQIDDVLLIEGGRYDVTDHSTYRNDEGYDVIEWCCEDSDTEAYVLKENQQGRIRWFFTKWIDAGGARCEDIPIKRWIPDHPGKPPPQLMYKKVVYTHKDTTDGTYEEEPGESEKKITWDYWNLEQTHNVAIELWSNGEIDAYLGHYLESREIRIRPETSAGNVGDYLQRIDSEPLGIAGILLCVVYGFFFIFVGKPFDATMAYVLPITVMGTAAFCFKSQPILSMIATACAGICGFIFSRFPPLSTMPGLAASLLIPLFLAGLARRFKWLLPLRVVLFFCGWSTGLPALLLGLHRYFTWAPGPHVVGQLILAIGPAFIVGTIGALAARILLSGADGDEISLTNPGAGAK